MTTSRSHPTAPATARPTAPAWAAGVLGRADGLVTALHTAFVVLVLASAVRYLSGHGFGDRAPWVLAGAVVLLAIYAAYRVLPARVWLALLVVVWFGLVLLAPSFAWCAVPLSFVALRVLPFWPACAVVAGMVVTTVVVWTRMTDRLDPTIVLGPVCVAVLAVSAYRALERDAQARQALLDDLHAAQGDLADAQHQAGVLAERGRLSREIHDSVAQGLSSINLLLQAAEREWDDRPVAAREHAAQAAATARDGLDEVRRVVRDLAPAELAAGGPALPDALRQTCERLAAHSGVDVQVQVHGTPLALGPEVETALLRTARGALANVLEHAAASTAVVTLTYQPDAVVLDVRDDGRGLGAGSSDPDRGRGLAGIRDRLQALGGTLVLESEPGEGTALAASIPLEES
ncbi:signal transduction histidine kinase [Kribbella steppae]|uniref:Oxygen sensor histidine kinase NreB n=1 Tax=Kribbella steppae TaxID=2512223 RepID=A0A4R2HWW3_9ACTN|nr:sensor histidine kinase [Kribbella steppae]TCO36061.1 signal transduction histidine kinase [Kribbella steppae]